MKRIIHYFIAYPKLNYVLLAFIFFMGISSYIQIPKEVFPDVSEKKIRIAGNYAGASPQSLNSFAVTEIENELASLADVTEIDSTIRSGNFVITLTLADSANIAELLDETKDAVSAASTNFPNDMQLPTVIEQKRTRPLLNVVLSGDQLNRSELMQLSKALQAKLYTQPDVSEVVIYGESDLQVDLFIDEKRARAYGVEAAQIIQKIKELSYIYPLGNVDQQGNHLTLATQTSKVDPKVWEDTLITVAGKKLYLGDVVDVTIGYPVLDTISRYNTHPSIDLSVLQGETGNAIEIAKGIKAKVLAFERAHPGLELGITNDSSKRIKDRLDTVTSNILLGLILVALLIYFMVSPRLSLVIILGVPFSFIITFIFLYYAGLTINMVTLLALLITIGIVVDDAIIVSENIQRHFDEGMERGKAVYQGTIEVIAPVLIASATTIFAFMPLLMMSGRMGAIIVMIPIVVSVTILASLIESFLFLPLHAKHLLKRKERHFNWQPIYTFHSKLLHFLIHYKRTFLLLFVLIVPLLTVISIKNTNFQFFPRLDADSLTFSIQLDRSYGIEQSDAIAKRFEARIMEYEKELFIDAISTTVGHYRPLEGGSESIENAFTLRIDLKEFDEDNWIQNYLNPIFTLSFDFEQASKVRSVKSKALNKKLRKILAPLIKEIKPLDFNIIGRRIGVVKTDIGIDLTSGDTSKLITTLQTLSQKLKSIEGIVDVGDNANLGKDEYKLKLNSYAQSLGLSDQILASTIANLYLERAIAYTVDPDGIVEIKTQHKDKDTLATLLDLPIKVGSTFIALKELTNIEISRDFSRIEKHDAEVTKTIFANVNPKTITANEVLQRLEPAIKLIQADGIKVVIRGEKEQNEKMKSELGRAFIVALFLIFIVLLINFNSFKSVFIIISVIPFTLLGALIGHFIMDMNLTFPSLIGILGLAGVVINDGIVMLDFLKDVKTLEEFYDRVKLRVRPILITSLTTMLGLATLIFYPSGQGVFLQPLAISLGFGLLWGTILNLLYLPALFALLHKLKRES